MDYMKKLFLAFAVLTSSLAFASPAVDGKIEKTFKESFPKAEKVTWYESDSYYEVLFTNNQVTCRMWYDHDGNVSKTERYYKEDGLSPFLLAKLNKKFPGKKVYGVTEVSTDGGTTYNIILEDEKQWYQVSADDAGSVHLDKKLLKA
jgi:hypothetical protein